MIQIFTILVTMLATLAAVAATITVAVHACEGNYAYAFFVFFVAFGAWKVAISTAKLIKRP